MISLRALAATTGRYLSLLVPKLMLSHSKPAPSMSFTARWASLKLSRRPTTLLGISTLLSKPELQQGGCPFRAVGEAPVVLPATRGVAQILTATAQRPRS